MKKSVLALGAIASLLVLGGITMSGVYAEDVDIRDTLATRLAEKLGISETTVQSALDESRAQMHEEMQAQREADLKEALDSGDITQRQYDLMLAVEDIREAGEPMRMKGDHTELLSQLNENGLNVTDDELETLMEVTRELGIMGGMGQGRHGGF